MRIAAAALAALAVIGARAYDFAAGDGGTRLYYNIVGDAVEVTYDSSLPSYNSYAGDVTVPATVRHGDKEYTVKGVGDRAFANCDELTSVKLPSGLRYIGTRSFLGCSALDAISLPSTLERIGANAFAWCDAVKTVKIPASTTDVAPNAFEGCLSLKEIDVASGNTAYTSDGGILLDADGSSIVIFPSGITEPYTVPLKMTAVGDQAFYGCSLLPEIKLPATIVSIGDNAFYFCNSLKSVQIPESVTHIGDNAFADCFSLSEINVDGSNPVYSTADGMLLDKAQTRVLQSPGGRVSHDSIPTTVVSIADYAFFRNYGLKHVTMPAGVEEIGAGAFLDCHNVVSVSLPSTLKGIGDFAFGMCSNLEHVYLDVEDPSTLKLGEEMFANAPLDKCTLYVPRIALTNYQGKIPWCYFAIIEGYTSMREQTIEWGQDLKPECGQHARLSAKASSGLPVSYAVSSASNASASIQADKVTFTTPGKLIVTAYQQGNHEYLPAKPVTKTINVRSDSGIDDVIADVCDIRVVGGDGRITVIGAAPKTLVCVYGIGGEEIYSGESTTVRVPRSRIYIVRVGSHAFKVAVK